MVVIVMIHSLDAFIETLPKGSAEREYHSAIARVISGIEFPRTADFGLGLIDFLTEDDFIVDGVDTRVHSVAGSREENAFFVSSLFAELNQPPAWWVAQSLSHSNPLRKWWKSRFVESPIVTIID